MKEYFDPLARGKMLQLWHGELFAKREKENVAWKQQPTRTRRAGTLLKVFIMPRERLAFLGRNQSIPTPPGTSSNQDAHSLKSECASDTLAQSTEVLACGERKRSVMQTFLEQGT